MVAITETTKFSPITIQGIEFNAPEIYAEGHVLSATEAGVLNQTLAENLRNNFASEVKAAKDAYRKANELADDADVAVENLDVDKLKEDFLKYASEYEFGARRSGGTRVILNPVEREAMNIARAKVREALKQKNLEASKDKIEELAAGILEKYPAIREEAQRRIDAQKNLAASVLEGLGDTV